MTKKEMRIEVAGVGGDLDEGWATIIIGPFASEEEARGFFEENVIVPERRSPYAWHMTACGCVLQDQEGYFLQLSLYGTAWGKYVDKAKKFVADCDQC